jgi:3-oxoacyl-(acyl-carrier-protein) synthase
VGDTVEAEAVNQVFGEASVPVSSTKSLHGHLLGGAGALEFSAAMLALEKGVRRRPLSRQPDPPFR